MTDIEFHTNSNIIYGASNGNASIYKSDDNGITWTQSGFGLPSTNNVVEHVFIFTLDNPQVVYALFGGNDNGFYGYINHLMKVKIGHYNRRSNLLGWDFDGSDSGGQAWYDLAHSFSNR